MHLTSRPVPAGHLVLARLPDGAAATAEFVDGSAEVDVTDWLCDLVLIGLAAAAAAHAPAVDAASTHAAGALRLAVPPDAAGGVQTGAGWAADPALCYFTYVHVPSGDMREFPVDEALRLAARGASAQLVAGVAHEVVEETGGIPDDPAGLTGGS